MKAVVQIDKLPTKGVKVILEGTLTRLMFDFTKHQWNGGGRDNEPHPDNLYDYESIDLYGQSYAEIVSAIVNGRYSNDEVQAITANFINAKDASSSLGESKRAEYLQEYDTFQAWREHAKEVAKTAVSLISTYR